MNWLQSLPKAANDDCPECFAAVLEYLHWLAVNSNTEPMDRRLFVISCGEPKCRI